MCGVAWEGNPSTKIPYFSVIVPLFNKGGYVRQTLESISNQKWWNYEVIVIDDGSTDNSVAEVYAAETAGLRLLAQANAGPGCARNRGIVEARGDWIAFLDADDIWLPDHLETLAAIIGAFPAADVVCSGFARVTRNGVRSVLAARRDCGSRARLADFFIDHQHVWTSTIAVRKSALSSTGGFNARWPGEDLELWTRLALDHTFAIGSRVTGIYMQETGGVMDSQSRGACTSGVTADDPVLETIDRAMSDHRYLHRQAAVLSFRNSLLRSYIRAALYHGKTRLARTYLSLLHAGGGRVPALYCLLSIFPPGAVRAASRTYGRLKHAMRLPSS